MIVVADSLPGWSASSGPEVPVPLSGSAGLRLRAPGPAMRTVALPVLPRPAVLAASVVLPAMVGASERAIRGLVDAVDVWLIVDDSGSMYGQWGDPTGIRYAAGRSLVGLLQRAGGGWVGVIHWGTQAPIELALRPAPVRKGRNEIRGALTIPPTLGGNDLPLALTRAQELSTGTSQGRRQLYYVLTDGIEPVTPAMHAALAALPERSVHMVLVDRSGGCDPAMEAAWRSCAFGSFTRLRTFDTKVMAYQLADIFAGSIGLKLPRANAAPSADDEPPPAESDERAASRAPPRRPNRPRLGAPGVLALIGVLMLTLLPTGGHRQSISRSTHVAPAPVSAPPRTGLLGVGMPATLPGNIPVRPVQIVFLAGRGRLSPRLIPELEALGLWLETHGNPSTRVTVLAPSAHGAAARLSAAELAAMRVIPRPSPTGRSNPSVMSALRLGPGKPLLVLFDHPLIAVPRTTAVLALRSVPGAQLADPVDVAPGHTLSLGIDSRRSHMLAATIARAVIKLTRMTEQRQF